MKVSLMKLGENIDHRGRLSSLEFRDLPFVVNRMFTINVNDLKLTRGDHAHKECWQLLVPMDYGVDVAFEHGAVRSNLPVEPGYALVVPPLTWITLHFKAYNSSVLVLASHNYDDHDYIRCYSEFKSL